jgi:hypothetical protein
MNINTDPSLEDDVNEVSSIDDSVERGWQAHELLEEITGIGFTSPDAETARMNDPYAQSALHILIPYVEEMVRIVSSTEDKEIVSTLVGDVRSWHRRLSRVIDNTGRPTPEADIGTNSFVGGRSPKTGGARG